jgi:hypothetical protein
MSDEEKELWVLIPGSRALYATRAEAESFLNGRASRDAEVDALQAELERGPVTPTVDASDLERRIREAKAEALVAAAQRWSDDPADDDEYTVRNWLLARAAEYRSGTTTEGIGN